MWGGGEMLVRSEVTSGRNQRWKWRPDARHAEDRKTTSDVSTRGARASDPALIFPDTAHRLLSVLALLMPRLRRAAATQDVRGLTTWALLLSA